MQMSRYFVTKDKAIAWIIREIEEILRQHDVPDFSNCLKIVTRIAYHKYAHYDARHEVTIIKDRERVAFGPHLPTE